MSVIILPPTQKSEPKKCPHCKEILPETEVPFAATILAILIMVYFISSAITLGENLVLAKYEKCEPLGSKRWHYVFPAPIFGCIAGRWLNNKEEIFKEN